jgi:hypothetical protein
MTDLSESRDNTGDNLPNAVQANGSRFRRYVLIPVGVLVLCALVGLFKWNQVEPTSSTSRLCYVEPADLGSVQLYDSDMEEIALIRPDDIIVIYQQDGSITRRPSGNLREELPLHTGALFIFTTEEDSDRHILVGLAKISPRDDYGQKPCGYK